MTSRKKTKDATEMRCRETISAGKTISKKQSEMKSKIFTIANPISPLVIILEYNMFPTKEKELKVQRTHSISIKGRVETPGRKEAKELTLEKRSE
jgi:hypothetical protein